MRRSEATSSIGSHCSGVHGFGANAFTDRVRPPTVADCPPPRSQKRAYILRVNATMASTSACVSVGSPIMKYSLRDCTPPRTSDSVARRISGSLRFLLITRRMRSEPASGATVTDRVAFRPRAAAKSGVITSALSDDGEARPPAWPMNSHSPATPGWLAISAPTRPMVRRSRSPTAAWSRNAARLR